MPARDGGQIAIPIFALAVLAKPQAGLLAPLGVAALMKEATLGEHRGKAIGCGLLGGVAVTLGNRAAVCVGRKHRHMAGG